MRKVLVCAMLFGAMAAFTTATPSSALAQGKKEKDTKKATKAGVIIVSEGKDGKYRYQVRDEDDKFLAGSTAYLTEKDAIKGVEDLKEVLSKAKVIKGKKAEAKEKDKK